MEGRHILKKILTRIAHLPTAMLVIGYSVFWLELYVLRAPSGRTTWTAWIVFGLVSLMTLAARRGDLIRAVVAVKEWRRRQKPWIRIFAVGVIGLFLFLLVIGLMASFLPPHLSQEYDFLNYHITLPRQHIISGSFAHLSWSVADLYLLPLDFAIAPYSLATALPNKIPFYFFFLGLVGVSAQLVWRCSRKNKQAVFALLLAILGSHGIVIQLGIAMFDLIMVYLFFAALDSFVEKNFGMAALEFAFYFWSKSFVPIQLCVLGMMLWAVFLIAKKRGWHPVDGWRFPEKIRFKRLTAVFALSSLLIGGPFVFKSLYYTGTPLYPFAPGLMLKGVYHDTAIWPSVVDRAQRCVRIRDSYGKGRGIRSFLEHFWILAVPEKGVNNRFDYPLGLPYLLVLAPFGVLFIENILKRRLDLMSWFCVLFWMSWWMGSQQSRFFYIPMLVMFVGVLSDRRFLSRVLLGALFAALLFSCLSVFRAHKKNLFRHPMDVLRAKDKELVLMSKSVDRGTPVEIDFVDAAFADFAVDVRNPGSIFVFTR